MAFYAWLNIAASDEFFDLSMNGSAVSDIPIVVKNELQITSIGMQIVFYNVKIKQRGILALANMYAHYHLNVAPISEVSMT